MKHTAPIVGEPHHLDHTYMGYNYINDNWGLPSHLRSYSINRKDDKIDSFIVWIKERYPLFRTKQYKECNKKGKDGVEQLDFILDPPNKICYGFSYYKESNGSTNIILRVNYVDESKVDKELIDRFISLKQKINTTSHPKIELIAINRDGYYLIQNNLQVTKTDCALHYNDDLKDELLPVIKNKLDKKEKGLFLFHGKPGTGKTSFIKHLTKLYPHKRFLFLPPNMSGQLSSPDFTEFLLQQKNTILVIEDAENILKKREAGTNQAISNLLNITDGLLADILNIVIICTFNCNYNEIDEALQRKGRLTARYEFKELEISKAQKLSDSIGFSTKIVSPMVLADIINQDKKSYKQEKTVIGF